jgi:hypothetical protein
MTLLPKYNMQLIFSAKIIQKEYVLIIPLQLWAQMNMPPFG